MTRWIVSIELVWWSPVEHATTVPAGIWAVQSRVWVKCTHSLKKCSVTRHDTGGLQVYVNKEQATEIGNETVTQKESVVRAAQAKLGGQ